jgi:hypothetical protein
MSRILLRKSKTGIPSPAGLSNSRKGVIVFAVLACLAIATMIVLAAVQSSLKQRRQLRSVTQMEQVRWLLDGGITKAIELVQKNADIPTDPVPVDLGQARFAFAQIEFREMESADEGQIKLWVTARIGETSHPETIQRSLEVWIPRQSN